jgi:hypothetical protein
MKKLNVTGKTILLKLIPTKHLVVNWILELPLSAITHLFKKEK